MSMNHIGHGAGDPVRLPKRMTRGEEFLALMDQRRRIDTRLNELAESLGADPIKLPKSGLRLVAVSSKSSSAGPASVPSTRCVPSGLGGRDHG